VNLDPTSGGEAASGWLEQRRDARRSVQGVHALVSSKDFEDAARELPDLEVGRAYMVPPSEADIATGTMRLVAMRLRRDGNEPKEVPESPRWLESVRRRLASRVALGARLRVIAPLYVDFFIRAKLEAEPRKNPGEVATRALEEVARRLVLVSDKPGVRERPFGLPVTRRDLIAWIQALPDVRRVQELTIGLPGRGVEDIVELKATGLPRFDRSRSQIEVDRSAGDAG
jgi:predicted phage baseplate assembly protein